MIVLRSMQSEQISVKKVGRMFAGLRKIPTFATANEKMRKQLSWQSITLPRLGSRVRVSFSAHVSLKCWNNNLCPGGGIGRRARFRCVCREACRFESCSGHLLIDTVILSGWWNWQTRYFEGVVGVGSCEFESHLGHLKGDKYYLSPFLFCCLLIHIYFHFFCFVWSKIFE